MNSHLQTSRIYIFIMSDVNITLPADLRVIFVELTCELAGFLCLNSTAECESNTILGYTFEFEPRPDLPCDTASEHCCQFLSKV